MGLTHKKEEQLRKQPIIESKYFLSANGKFIVHKTTITDIKPVVYMEKVLVGDDEALEQLEQAFSEEFEE